MIYMCKPDVRSITIGGETILEIDVNRGWWIPKVEYDGSMQPHEVDELTVTFKRMQEWVDGDTLLGCPRCGYGWPKKLPRPKYCPECGTRLA